MQLTNEAILLFLSTAVLTYFILRKMEATRSIFSYLYIGLISFAVISFSLFTWKGMIDSVTEIYEAIGGEKYTAIITSSYDLPENYTQTQEYASLSQIGVHTRIKVVSSITYSEDSSTLARFITKKGEILTKPLGFSSESYSNGDAIKIVYNSATDRIISFGFPMVIKFVGIFLFFIIFNFVLWGMILFASDRNMDFYFNLLSSFAFYFFIPFLMIGFDALLVYGLFNGNDVPLFASLILCFFILVLTLAIYGYLKMTFSKGKPKMKRVSATRWEGDWEDDENNEDY